MEKEYTIDEIVNALTVAFSVLIDEGNKPDFNFLAGVVERIVAEAHQKMAERDRMN